MTACAPRSTRFEAEVGPIDILVNNAGMQYRTPLEDFPADAFERLLQTNVASVFHVGQAVRPPHDRARARQDHQHRQRADRARPSLDRALYRHQGRGRQPDQGHGHRLGQVRAANATPSRRATSTPRSTPRWWPTPDFSAWLEKRTPAGRWGKVEELVGAAVFLSSAASSFVNGHILYVDGGITASL